MLHSRSRFPFFLFIFFLFFSPLNMPFGFMPQTAPKVYYHGIILHILLCRMFQQMFFRIIFPLFEIHFSRFLNYVGFQFFCNSRYKTLMIWICVLYIHTHNCILISIPSAYIPHAQIYPFNINPYPSDKQQERNYRLSQDQERNREKISSMAHAELQGKFVISDFISF